MADLAISGYTVDDLDWLRDEIGVAHLELDPWGSLIVSPADDHHETTMALSTGASDSHIAPGGVSVSSGLNRTDTLALAHLGVSVALDE